MDDLRIKPGGAARHMPMEELILDYKRSVFRMAEAAGGGYIAQALSNAEVFAALFYRVLRLDPDNPKWEGRDRFLLSVGHYVMGVYATLAKIGYFKEELLDTYSEDGSILEMISTEYTPGIEISGGSLAQGLSQGVGLALAGKLRNAPWRVYVMISDGELQEGQTWEAAMVANHHHLDNLTVILDYNGAQVDGELFSGILPIAEKWKAFGWNVIEVNGNDSERVLHVLQKEVTPNGMPTIMVSKTVMGNGVSFLHGKPDVHYVKWSKELTDIALEEMITAGGAD